MNIIQNVKKKTYKTQIKSKHTGWIIIHMKYYKKGIQTHVWTLEHIWWTNLIMRIKCFSKKKVMRKKRLKNFWEVGKNHKKKKSKWKYEVSVFKKIIEI